MVNTLSGVTNGSTGAVLTGGGAFVGNRNLMDEGERKMRSGSNQINNGAAMIDAANLLWDGERYNAFKATKNSAFFYTKKNDKKVLLQINKDTGDAV